MTEHEQIKLLADNLNALAQAIQCSNQHLVKVLLDNDLIDQQDAENVIWELEN